MAQQSADTKPDAGASRASPRAGGRPAPALRRVVHGVLFVALPAAIFSLLPRLGGLTREAARPSGLPGRGDRGAGGLATCYAQLYRRMLAALTRALDAVGG